MMNKGDFLLIELEGRDEKGNVFDSTKGEIAKKLHGKEKPMLVVFGKAVMIPGLEKLIEKMNEGEEKEAVFGPDEAFGKRRKDLIKVMPLRDFAMFNVDAKPGTRVHMDTNAGTIYGTVKSRSSGRVMVDFNHPLAGKKVMYKVKVLKVASKPEEKLNILLDNLGIEAKVEVKGKRARVAVGSKGFENKKALILINAKQLIPELEIEVVKK
ncbi:MAG: FKBP-type peptidyl-prolyl cis-trans isomerase [Candidatus Micrarchaeia archaeon]